MAVSAKDKPNFLVHVCCAPCSPHPIKLLKDEYTVTLFFYNPNIHPQSEYLFRLAEVEKLAEIENLPLVVGDYKPKSWIMNTVTYKNDPEGGRRCEWCIDDRLSETAQEAARQKAASFGTVLSVSPHKDALLINRLGKGAESGLAADGVKISYFEANFKKKDGFKISSQKSREFGFKRQNYCGCVYSRLEAVRVGRLQDGAGTA